MQPDYTAIVNGFIKPAVSLFLFAFLILGWVIAFRLMKENTALRIKLGKENEEIRESFKIWVMRKSAPMMFQIYFLKTFLREKQFDSALKAFFKKNVLRLAFRFGIVASIVSNIFGIDNTSVVE